MHSELYVILEDENFDYDHSEEALTTVYGVYSNYSAARNKLDYLNRENTRDEISYRMESSFINEIEED